MSSAYDVSIVIINYNGKKYIDVLTDGLRKLRHEDFSFEIVFVDNASSDDSMTYLEEKTKDMGNVKMIRSENNLGFAGGNNLGVSMANGKYIVLLNNDTCPEPDWLEKMYHYISAHPDVVMVNSKLVFFYDFIRVRFFTQDKILLKREVRINGEKYIVDAKFCKNCLCEPDQMVCFGHTEICIPLLYGDASHTFIFEPIQCADTDRLILADRQIEMEQKKPFSVTLSQEEVFKSRITLIQNAGSGINEKLDGYDIGFCEEDGEKFQTEYEINNGCGAAIMFKKEDFVNSGGFDERFFMYYEDTDLSCRMKHDGRKIMYCPSAVVRHIHAGSSGEWSPFFIYHVSKNKLLFVAKNYGRKKFLKCFFRQLLSGIKHRDSDKRKGTMKAFSMVMKDIFNASQRHCPHLIQKDA